MHTRLTEPERLMEEMVESHEAKTKGQLVLWFYFHLAAKPWFSSERNYPTIARPVGQKGATSPWFELGKEGWTVPHF